MAVLRSSSSVDTLDPRILEVHEVGQLTIRFYLQGFKKEHLRVQLGSSGTLKVSGERSQLGASGNRRTQFWKEVAIPQGYNLDEISAKFADGVLQVTIPKLQQQEPEQKPASQQQGVSADQEQDAPQQHKPAVSQQPAAESTEGKDKYGAEKEKEPGIVPSPTASLQDADSPAGTSVVGLRRRRPSFASKIRYGSGLSTKTRGTGFKTAAALLLLLAGLWFAYLNYWARNDSNAATSLVPFHHYHPHHHDAL